MSTTNGNMKSFKVTDKDGNVFVMTPVDTVAQQAIDEAKNLQFDEDYFTSEVSQDQTTVSVGLNGVPLGVDSDSPLKFVQDDAQGIVFGSNAPFSTAIAPEYDSTATYAVGDRCMYLGKYYECNTAISTTEEWDSTHWTETNIISTANKMLDGGNKTESDFVSGVLSIDYTNSLTKLTLTTVQALTIEANSGIPNFALEIDNTGNSNDVNVTVTDTAGTNTLNYSTAGGNVVGAGKYVQLTCVGNCWTMAEFTVPTP